MIIDRFYRDSFILTLSNLATGIIGFIFSIVLSNKLGAEGLGLYGLVMPVYGLLLCLTSDGLITALSRISAVYASKRDFNNLNRTLTTIFVFIALWSLTVTLLVFINSSSISAYIIRDPRVSGALAIICPALVFVPMSAILKGYFYGLGKFKTPASIDIFEKFLRLAILTGTIAVLSLQDVRSTVAAAYLALAAGEFISFILLYTFYRINKSKTLTAITRPKNRLQLLFDILVISCPLCLNGFTSSLLSAASALILPRRLISAGIPYDSALSLIGKFSGMALNITCLPFIIVSSMLTVLIPDLSLSMSRKDPWATENRISQVLKISCLVGISTLIVSLVIPGSLGKLFYNSSDLGGMIRFASVAAFTAYLSSPTFGILNGLGKQNANLRNSLLISVQGLVLTFILTGIPALNIYGYGITIIITSLTALFLNMYEIRKTCDLRLPLMEFAAYAAIGLFSYFILMLLNHLLPGQIPALKAGLITALGFAMVFFLSNFV